MITGPDVQKQMEKEIASGETTEAQCERLEVDFPGIVRHLESTGGASSDEAECVAGGILLGLEFAGAKQ